MANVNDYNYSNIENPYNNYLERGSDESETDSSGAENFGSSGSGSLENISNASGQNVPQEEKLGGNSFDNIWLGSWIKSKNYSPKVKGFYIDGLAGYIECMKLYVGSGGIIGGKLDIPDETTANSFHTDNDGNSWWGANVATGYVGANASILKTGVVSFVSGTIGGCVLGATSISSTTFVSGPLGSGWNISNTGTAELQDVTIRGTIRTSVFEKDTLSCVNGMVLISSSDVLDADMTALDSSTLTISGETTFSANEVIRVKDGINDEWMLVTDASGAPTYVVTRDLVGSYAANNNPEWKKGTAIVSMGVGTGTKTGFVLLDSSSANSPYIDIYGRNSNTYNDYTLHGRFGWLKGITDTDVGLNSTDVWGLYTDNAYIKGVVVANTGYIGGSTGWVISSNYIKDVAGVTGMSSVVTAGDDIRFWAGHVTPSSAPFRVTESGALTATSATITDGVITGGTIQTATSGARISITGGTFTVYNTLSASVVLIDSGATNYYYAGYASGSVIGMKLFANNASTTANILDIEGGNTSGQAIKIDGSGNTNNYLMFIDNIANVGLYMESDSDSGKPTLQIAQQDVDKTAVLISNDTYGDVSENNIGILEVVENITGLSPLYLKGYTKPVLVLDADTQNISHIRFLNGPATADNLVEGDLWYDHAASKFKYYNGVAVRAISSEAP